jgi:hypothetical protein
MWAPALAAEGSAVTMPTEEDLHKGTAQAHMGSGAVKRDMLLKPKPQLCTCHSGPC